MRRDTPEVQIKEDYTAGLEVLCFSLPQKEGTHSCRNPAATKPSFLSRKQGPAADWLMGGSLSLWKASSSWWAQNSVWGSWQLPPLTDVSLQKLCLLPCPSPAVCCLPTCHPGCPTLRICLLNHKWSPPSKISATGSESNRTHQGKNVKYF